MKYLNKIIAACLSATALLTSLIGVTVFADASVTGEQLKTLATKNTMDQSPYLDEILKAEFLQSDPDADITQTKKIRDYIDPKKAFRVVNDAYYITQFFKPGVGTAKSYEEAFEQSNKGTEDYDYYMPCEKTYNEFGDENNAYRVQVNLGYGNEVFVNAYDEQYLYDFDSEYDKVAELINKNNLGTPTEVLLFNQTQAMGVTTEKGSYFFPFKEYTNQFAEYLDKPVSKIIPNTVYTVEEYNEYYSNFFNDQKQARTKLGQKLLEAMPDVNTYDESIAARTDDTDSFSQYIGTVPQYSDITNDQVAVTNQLTDLGVINGDGGMFYPDETVTRAEASAMLCRMFDIEPKAENTFSDVTSSHWAAKYIGALAAEGIINGFEDSTFRPEENVTYEQVFKMVESLLGYTYEDNVWRYGEYPTGQIIAAAEMGLSDDLGSFHAGDNISRIELACVLSRALDTHITTCGFYINEFGLQLYSYEDITLSAYKNGGSLYGTWLRSDKAQREFDNNFEKEYEEKCGAVIDEFNEKTGCNDTKKISGGICSAYRNGNPIPRITEEKYYK